MPSAFLAILLVSVLSTVEAIYDQRVFRGFINDPRLTGTQSVYFTLVFRPDDRVSLEVFVGQSHPYIVNLGYLRGTAFQNYIEIFWDSVEARDQRLDILHAIQDALEAAGGTLYVNPPAALARLSIINEVSLSLHITPEYEVVLGERPEAATAAWYCGLPK
ncbi:hypothetical protein FOL47_008075 [Perkinsus chesapeaki]|uniref:Uncharacterized protein n=1 Tax=Perkinsus chesapeaki TaxID=330153 RepID=A0A7J6MUY6_PERCH|nr:hypothetical protein FOL47_008075 [Perkinsus chesapeaki]